MKITILGTGAYSISLALTIAKNKDNNITLWTESNKVLKEFQNTHKLSSILDKKLPDNINITTSYKEALNDAKMIIIACSSKYVNEVTKNIKDYYNNIPICIASKGIEESSLMFLSNIVKRNLKTNKIAIISGPTFAIDLANNEPCALAIASKNKNIIKLVKQLLENESLKLRETNDLIGIQICGSVKNIIAIASGIINGLDYSNSTQAFLLNESIHDIKYLINALGGNTKTILSFAGIGDLMLTCTSKKSRNYSFGYIIGKNKDKETYLKNNTVEGYNALLSIYNLIKKHHIDLPIIEIIYDIVIKDDDPKKLIEFLITKK